MADIFGIKEVENYERKKRITNIKGKGRVSGERKENKKDNKTNRQPSKRFKNRNIGSFYWFYKGINLVSIIM